MQKGKILFVTAAVIALSCTGARDADILPRVPEGAQAVSLMGDPLYPLTPGDKALADYEAAKKNVEEDPDDADNLIWLGRRAAYAEDYREAIRIYTRGIRKFPDDPRFYRHRGHRYISIRQFDRAIQDLHHAAMLIEGQEDKVEPDGIPNARNIPVSSLHTNIWYHLGLAYYLKNDLLNAMRAYRSCLEASKNADMIAATSHWLTMTLRRLEWEEQAASVLDLIDADMDIIENMAYHQLLLFYKGDVSQKDLQQKVFTDVMNDATAYGIGNWYLYNGQRDKAEAVFEKIIAGRDWATFGHIAAEADVAREFTQTVE